MQYENILIGDFLFSLGYITSQKKISDNQVDLYQQTPLDSKVGDVLAKIGGQNFIVEFKREEKLIKNELLKKSKEAVLKDELEQHLLLISYKSHFLSFPKNNSLEFIPYISLNQHYKKLSIATLTFSELIDGLMARTKGASAIEIREYCNLLEKKSYKSSSGIIVNVLNGRKPLVLMYSDGFSMEKKMEIEITIEQSLGSSKGMNKSKGIDFSF